MEAATEFSFPFSFLSILLFRSLDLDHLTLCVQSQMSAKPLSRASFSPANTEQGTDRGIFPAVPGEGQAAILAA